MADSSGMIYSKVMTHLLSADRSMADPIKAMGKDENRIFS
jgi:hypothetical protein